MRNGPEVGRERVETLDEALAAAREAIDRSRRGGRLETVSALREFTPDQRVQTRVEVSGKGLLFGPEAGIDLMGDGAVVAYSGALRKRELDADGLDEALAAVRAALNG